MNFQSPPNCIYRKEFSCSLYIMNSKMEFYQSMDGCYKYWKVSQNYVDILFIIKLMDRQTQLQHIIQQKPFCIHIRLPDANDGEIRAICSKIDTKEICVIDLKNEDQIPMSRITHQAILFISGYYWESLKIVDLSNNNIGDKGCKYLTMTQMPLLEVLDLTKNQIGDYGLVHLSKGKWNQLKQLFVSKVDSTKDKIKIIGIQYLVKGNWKKMNHLNVGRNEITIQQIRWLLISQFPLKSLNIENEVEIEISRVKKHIYELARMKYPNLPGFVINNRLPFRH